MKGLAKQVQEVITGKRAKIKEKNKIKIKKKMTKETKVQVRTVNG